MGENGYPFQTNPSGGRLTSACAPGYEGYLCSQCSENYYQGGLACRSCSLDNSDRPKIIASLCVAVAFFFVVLVSVVVLSSSGLSTIVIGQSPLFLASPSL